MALTGDSSHHFGSYSLPATDVQRSRRNYPGYEEKTYYSLADIRNAEWKFHTGTTDTDDATDTNEKEMKKGYAGIYQKEGLPKPRPTNQDSPLEKADYKARPMSENYT